MDTSRLPAPVLGKLALVGYWSCHPDLRDRLSSWDRLDEGEARVAENDLRLLASALAR